MELKDVVSVAGKPGLHKIIGKGLAGLVLESLEESAKRTMTPVTQKVSILEDVSIYTEESDVKLFEVFKKMSDLDKAGKLTPLSKKSSAEEIKNWFTGIVPDYNKEKVYNSDILKVYTWFTMINGKIDFDAKPEAEESEATDKEKVNVKTKTVKPVKKVQAKGKTSKGATKTSITSRKMS